jgi:predicted MPP superfamily phosphohydrolase
MSTLEDGFKNLHELSFITNLTTNSFYAIDDSRGHNELLFLQTIQEMLKQEIGRVRRDMSSVIDPHKRSDPPLTLEQQILLLPEEQRFKVAYGIVKLHKLIVHILTDNEMSKLDIMLSHQPDLADQPFDVKTFDILFRLLVEGLK